MNLNTLKLGKAMSAALFVLLLSVAGMKNALGQNLVATLQHGEDISVFYGSNAFIQAHEVAQTGDIITLSSGTFNPTTITKAITLRGAGCCMDTITGIYPTKFSDNLRADILDEEHFLTMEGILIDGGFYFGTLNNPRFVKCNFGSFNYDEYGATYGTIPMLQNAIFVNCMIYAIYGFIIDPEVHAINTQFLNCYVKIYPEYCTIETNVSFVNSIVAFINTTEVENVLAINSIFHSGLYYDYMPTASSSCLFNNCVAVGSYGNALFSNQTNTTNQVVNDYSYVFDTFIGNYYMQFSELINERFVLKDDFATSVLGNDGTEVGIHGGTYPYNPRPNYMVLKRCNVANQSTIDNKLSVEIEVVAEGE